VARRAGAAAADGTACGHGHAGPRLAYARVLGPHPLLLGALARRLAEAGVGPSSAVVLAAAGSADPDANAEVARMARLLWEWRGGAAPVEAAFASATRPRVDAAVERLRLLGHTEIAVASYFLAPGRLPDTVAGLAAGLPVTAPLADSDEVARLVLERYTEALGGTFTGNCDTCVYRTPWPGHEHRVGAPQRVHPHPADPPVPALAGPTGGRGGGGRGGRAARAGSPGSAS
jgi:sirohydrochlorin cobaltochelatase